jgi:hypothetical protein
MMENKVLLIDWLIKERGEIKEELETQSAIETIETVAVKMDKGIVSIKDGHIIQKLRIPIGETKELKYKKYYTAKDQAKAARNMKTEGELSLAHNLIACLTDKTQAEIGKLVDKDISTAVEIEALYFL